MLPSLHFNTEHCAPQRNKERNGDGDRTGPEERQNVTAPLSTGWTMSSCGNRDQEKTRHCSPVWSTINILNSAMLLSIDPTLNSFFETPSSPSVPVQVTCSVSTSIHYRPGPYSILFQMSSSIAGSSHAGPRHNQRGQQQSYAQVPSDAPSNTTFWSNVRRNTSPGRVDAVYQRVGEISGFQRF